MTRGRLDAQVTVPSGGWTFAAVGTSSANATVAAGPYYQTTFATALSSALSTATGDTVTVTVSNGETGTGLVTIGSTANLSGSWTSTAMRDYLGFTGNLTAATSHVGSRQCQSIWLPNAEIASHYGNGDEGHTETDMATTESPQGDVKGLVYASRVVLPSVRWTHVEKPYARISGETVVGASFERWWRNTQAGELAYFAVLAPFRLYWDASSSDHKTYRCPRPRGTAMDRTVDPWAYLYGVELSRLVRVPGT